MLDVVFIISVTDKEDWYYHNKKIIESYKKINPTIITVYNGNNPNFECDVRIENLGHSRGHFPQIKAGYQLAKKTRIPRIVNLCADDWLLDEDVILDIFKNMEEQKTCIGCNYWFKDSKDSLSSEIFFADLRFGDFFEKWTTWEPEIEKSLFRVILDNFWDYYIIEGREPVHDENRFVCEKLKWTMQHNLQDNLNKAKEWGYEPRE